MDTKLDVGFESYVTHTYMRQYLINMPPHPIQTNQLINHLIRYS